MENKVELIGHYGGDITHAQSAWTSTYRDLTEEKRNRMDKLLAFLARKGHHTPFEKSSLHFLVTTDIASHIHLLKHRIGVSINAESARYKELKEDKYYIPEDWKAFHPDKNAKENDTLSKWNRWLEIYTDTGNNLYHECLEELTPILGRKRAKESARFFKAYNSQITADVMFNFRSFVHFQNLSNDEHAQLEIREIADTILQQVKDIDNNPFDLTLKAFKL